MLKPWKSFYFERFELFANSIFLFEIIVSIIANINELNNLLRFLFIFDVLRIVLLRSLHYNVIIYESLFSFKNLNKRCTIFGHRLANKCTGQVFTECPLFDWSSASRSADQKLLTIRVRSVDP